MGWIYGYLISWVAGGVLLAGELLLSGGPVRAQKAAAERVAAPGAGATRRTEPWLGVLWMGLIGFGGAGLVLEATGSLADAERRAGALAAGLLLAGCGAALRPRGA